MVARGEVHRRDETRRGFGFVKSKKGTGHQKAKETTTRPRQTTNDNNPSERASRDRHWLHSTPTTTDSASQGSSPGSLSAYSLTGLLLTRQNATVHIFFLALARRLVLQLRGLNLLRSSFSFLQGLPLSRTISSLFSGMVAEPLSHHITSRSPPARLSVYLRHKIPNHHKSIPQDTGYDGQGRAEPQNRQQTFQHPPALPRLNGCGGRRARALPATRSPPALPPCRPAASQRPVPVTYRLADK
ncbi:hypothetical protein JOL62DRAFT_123553 [Phyllosticta paracitricarpa]|uniref:Uncharacterized protein n=1 Tax=Phyllosticta paracitricarpa TaxID=2016321 RepID=A0ABR1N642_9PEZI